MPYLNLKYKPVEDDLICEFYFEPEKGINPKKVADHLAAESSTGTWTEVKTAKPYVKKLGARVFFLKNDIMKVAYPIELFEYDNIPNIMSSVAGNIFGMKEAKNLRLLDIHFPEKILRAHHGPKYGIQGIRKLLRVEKRPLVGTIIKPKLGLKTGDHARAAYNSWAGGCDIVKDDENLSNQRFNPFDKRTIKTLEMRDKAESETGEKKIYMVNVTAETSEMLRRAQFVKDHGGEYVMVDIMTCGFSALQTLRNADMGLVLHAHRAMHAALTRNKKHGISMMVIAKLCRLIGMDQLHTGTIIGKMEGARAEVQDINNEIKWNRIGEHHRVLRQEWDRIKPTLPVASGGLNPAHVPILMELLGKDLAIQMGGGIHGHPQGTKRGATAARQAIDAAMQGISLKEYAKGNKELAAALRQWKTK
jgi:ribulose-bisphosphate carboxylase large chain